jgi:peptidoglycan/LPS O-acetylase OafA/YrhL
VPLDELEPEQPQSNLAAIAFALGGVLVFAGGVFLRAAPAIAGSSAAALGSYWLAFMVGGLAMVAIALLLSRGARWAQVAAIIAVTVLIVVFALAVQNITFDPNDLLAYGFLAGGIVVGVSVLFSGRLSREP